MDKNFCSNKLTNLKMLENNFYKKNEFSKDM